MAAQAERRHEKRDTEQQGIPAHQINPNQQARARRGQQGNAKENGHRAADTQKPFAGDNPVQTDGTCVRLRFSRSFLRA